MTPANDTYAQIQASTPTGELTNVENLDHSTVKETTGVWQTPTGDNTAQIAKMGGQVNKYYILLDNGYLQRDTVWRIFLGTIWAQLKYLL